MEYIAKGNIKVTSFHPRTHSVKEINYFILVVFWSWFLIHGNLTFCQDAWKSIQFHSFITVQLYIIFDYCSWTRTVFMLLFSSWFSASQASLVSTEHHYGLLFSPNTFSSETYLKKKRGKQILQNQQKNPHTSTTRLHCLLCQKSLFCLPENSSSLHGGWIVTAGQITTAIKTEHGEMKWGQRAWVAGMCVRTHVCERQKRKSSLFGFVYPLQHFRGSQQSPRKLLLICFPD